MIYARAELYERAGGHVARNVYQLHGLTDEERSYLIGLGVDVEEMLAEMNGRMAIAADIRARRYAVRIGDVSGTVKGPVLTMHALYDEQTPAAMESACRDTVEADGNGDLLVQEYTDGVGNCQFTRRHLLRSIEAVEYWLETGTAPGDGCFPEAMGFDNAFVPPPWP